MNNLERQAEVQLDRKLHTSGLMTKTEREEIEGQALEMGKNSLLFIGRRLVSAKVGPVMQVHRLWTWLRDVLR